MERPEQRGSTLAEAAVTVAIVSLVAGAVLDAALSATRGAAGGVEAAALQASVERELRVALDVLKYDDATVASTSIATAVPMATGSPLPVRLSIATAPNSGGALRVTIEAVADDGSGKRASLSATLNHRAVLPGSRVRAPGLAPAPTGAP